MITTRRTLLLALALVVIAGPSVLIALRAHHGAASFAADERVGRNELSAARVDIEVGSRMTAILGTDLAPGDVRRGSIELVNRGSVGLRYALRGRAVGAANRELAEWMAWRASWSSDGLTCPTRLPADAVGIAGSALAAGGAMLGDPSRGSDPGDRVLDPGESDLLCLEVELHLAAPNSVQSSSIVQPIVAEAEQLVDTMGTGS